MWISFDSQFKEQIKQAIIYNLATPSSMVRTQVASAVAAIAAIEIPRKEWLDLIPNLSNNSAHEQIDIRNASLQTLGFICEEI
jgi:importin subunit beta-1